MKVDLRIGGSLNPELKAEYNKIAKNIRGSFNEFIEVISTPYLDNLDWWVAAPASRNIFYSNIFYYCCYLTLLKDLLDQDREISLIIVDSKKYKSTIDCYLGKRNILIPVIFIPNIITLTENVKNLLKPTYVVTSQILTLLRCFISIKTSKKLKKQIPQKPLVLIDTFVVPGFTEKDRYYSGLWEKIPLENRESIYFVPTLVNFSSKQFVQTLQKLRDSKRNFFLKEDFLKLTDYVFAIAHLWRKKKIRIDNAWFSGFNLSKLIKDEFISNKIFVNATIGILNYRFAKRLKETNVKLKRVINWCENQPNDKGWNIGFSKFYPEIDKIGYQGFASTQHELCTYPTKFESINGILPEIFALMGAGCVEDKKKFFPELKTIIVPAFRFSWLWKTRNYLPSNSYFSILVALPVTINDAIKMLRLIYDMTIKFKNHDFHFLIKPHPLSSIEKIVNQINFGWPQFFKIVKNDFHTIIEKSHVLIGSASQTCLETVACGIPIIVLGNFYGLPFLPIPDHISDNIWRHCHSVDEMKDAISYFKDQYSKSPENFKKIGDQIRKDYFSPVTSAAIDLLIGSEEC
jgi:hypothetical protein